MVVVELVLVVVVLLARVVLVVLVLVLVLELVLEVVVLVLEVVVLVLEVVVLVLTDKFWVAVVAAVSMLLESRQELAPTQSAAKAKSLKMRDTDFLNIAPQVPSEPRRGLARVYVISM